ncbi:hypothetical protein Q5O14_07215 [Eubacteriaceae bacterium ES2]|nr:hypothetical protein Q5O14_07215 [Eubacteriaceae bacterium ES2]
MKKKFFLIFIFLLLPVLIIIGCSNGNTDEASQSDTEQTNDQSSSGVDENLTDAELLNSLNIGQPDSLAMTSITNGIYATDTTTTTMIQGGNSRMEMNLPDIGNQIIIYNAAEGITYQYVEGQTTGMMFSDSTLDSDLADDFDTEEMTSSFSDFTSDLNGNYIARIEELNGEKVIYIETTEDSGEDGIMQVKMWYSLQYGVPLKYEIYSQDELIASTEVQEISTVPIDSSLFEKPSGIEFTDFSNLDLGDLSEMYSIE